MLSEEAQEILETLYVSEREEKKDVLSEGLEKKRLEELYRAGLAKPDGKKVRMTEAGSGEGEKIVRRNRLAERLLHDVLTIGDTEMESQACKFEHFISEEVEESICTLLGHPKECPHGKKIPPGKCCKAHVSNLRVIFSDMSQMKKGDKGKIAYLLTGTEGSMEKLLAMGIKPGEVFTVIQTFPAFVFRVGESEIAIDTEIASSIVAKKF